MPMNLIVLVFKGTHTRAKQTFCPCPSHNLIYRNVSTAIEDDSKVNYSLALQYLKKSAHLGYPDAIYFMGQVSELGMLGQLCDSWQAYQHYVKAADVNHAGAMLDLSRIYSHGISGLLAAQKDIAFKWCKKSADLGFHQAEYVLG